MLAAQKWYHPVSIFNTIRLRPRIYLGALAGAIVFLLLPSTRPQSERMCIAWDVGALVYLFFAFRLMLLTRADHVRTGAAQRDDSRFLMLCIILMSIGVSFVAIWQLIMHAKAPSTDLTEKSLLAVLAVITIIASWTVTQVAFTLHYAHEYYMPHRGSGAEGGLDFPGCEKPDYWDFLYFAVSVGATSQTSDTAVRSQNLRRLVTLHAALAFFFNTAVLALTVNIAAGLA
jgi:uncharacterized membrane protein